MHVLFKYSQDIDEDRFNPRSQNQFLAISMFELI